MCRVEGSDPATVYRERIVRARKPHQCGECGRVISVGERYRYAFSVYEGWGSSYYTCEHCCSGADWLARECGGYIFSEVAEELWEHASEYPDLAIPLRRLFFGIQRRWKFFSGKMMLVPSIPAEGISHVVYGTISSKGT